MSQRRYELSDFEWSVIEPLLPNKPLGVPRVDDRRVLNGIYWRLRTGELCGKMGDGGGLKAAYRGGCRACQNLSRRAIRHDRAYQRCPISPAR
jgi:hypothetical protein